MQLPDYPIKITSRNIPANRATKLRAAWFVLGIAFGIGCTSALTPVSLPQFHASQQSEPEAPELATAADTALPELAPPSLIVPAAPATVAGNAEIAVAAPPITESITYPRKLDVKVQNGDTFVSVLNKAGITIAEAHEVTDAVKNVFNPKSLNAGKAISLTLDMKPDSSAPHLTELALPISAISRVEVVRDEKSGKLTTHKIDQPLTKKLARAGGEINSSLYTTLVSSGLPASMVGDLIKAYSYDVDFQREIREGDTIDVAFERLQTEDGKVGGYGNLIYAALDLGDRNIVLYRYTDKSGNTDFYNAKGESVRKALLRTPINGARISSGFGMREHPILGYSKMHKGVDFAAAIGTPVYAAGDGVVNFAGRKGGYGNYLQIKHNDKYASAYGHLSRFASGIASGKKVKQGQVVAYVGNTGMSTGPHLHYEMLIAGNQVNPANVKFKTGNMLGGKELASFKRNVETIQANLASMPRGGNKVASADNKKNPTN